LDADTHSIDTGRDQGLEVSGIHASGVAFNCDFWGRRAGKVGENGINHSTQLSRSPKTWGAPTEENTL
jgi:hypothetical protein